MDGGVVLGRYLLDKVLLRGVSETAHKFTSTCPAIKSSLVQLHSHVFNRSKYLSYTNGRHHNQLA